MIVNFVKGTQCYVKFIQIIFTGMMVNSLDSLAVISIIFVLLLQSCEQGGDITIKNLHNEEVSIFVRHVREDGSLGERTKQLVIPANATKTFSHTFIGEDWVDRIEAIDASGKVVFSHDYEMADLEKIEWKIVIPAS